MGDTRRLIAHLKAVGLIRFSMVKMPEIIKEDAEMQSNNKTVLKKVAKVLRKLTHGIPIYNNLQG